MLRRTLCLLFVIFFTGVPSLYSQDAVPACKLKYEHQINILFDHLKQVENSFAKYRWTEAKIRELFYERLWHARRDMRHPLSKSTRELGKEEEKRLLLVLKDYEAQSREASNGFVQSADFLLGADTGVSQVCHERDYEDCIVQSFQEFYAVIDEMKKTFGHFFEFEREYRLAIQETTAGKKGFYPEDALEISDEHTDYYWRFERERETARFQENSKMMDYFHDAQKILAWNFKGDQCCYDCKGMPYAE